MAGTRGLLLLTLGFLNFSLWLASDGIAEVSRITSLHEWGQFLTGSLLCVIVFVLYGFLIGLKSFDGRNREVGFLFLLCERSENESLLVFYRIVEFRLSGLSGNLGGTDSE